jgi:class 3 adenylate cyclase
MHYPELHYRWEWRLRSTPEQLWPLVSDTNRFNRDTGLPTVRRAPDVAQRNARQRLGFARFGVRLEWDEEPFEWVRPYRFGVRRRYRAGPVASMRVRAALRREPDGGTHLRYETWVRPRTLLGMAGVPVAMALVTRRTFGATFRRYDAMPKVADAARAASADVRLAPGGEARLAALQRQLMERTDAPDLVAWLVAAMRTVDDFAMARLRPYALADAWGVPRRNVLELCLRATRLGLLDLQWDVLCPLCRGVKARSTLLAEATRQVHCDVCNIDFAANFDRSVEVTFRPNPSIRAVEETSYCVGGPQVTPHIVAQLLLAAGDRRNLTLPLEPGRYRLRTLGLPGGAFLAATSDGADEATIAATEDGWPRDERAVSLSPTLHLANATDAEHLFILERMQWTDQATTAAEVTTLQLFRDLFASELLRPGEQISVGSLTILFTDLRDSTAFYRSIGDAPAFAQVLDHFAVLRAAIDAEGGAIIKTIGDAVMAAFRQPCAALRAMLRAQAQLAAPANGAMPLHLKVGMHFGPCIAVTMNDRLDYFGSTVNMASRLERFSAGTDIIISDVIRNDPAIAAFLSAPASGLAVEAFAAHLKGFDEERFPLWRVADLARPA